jgi:hypothetical protein
MAGQPTQGDRVVDRAEVEKLLQRVGVDDERIATALDGVEFPDRASRILGRLQQQGITTDRLVDRMGGSP